MDCELKVHHNTGPFKIDSRADVTVIPGKTFQTFQGIVLQQSKRNICRGQPKTCTIGRQAAQHLHVIDRVDYLNSIAMNKNIKKQISQTFQGIRSNQIPRI